MKSHPLQIVIADRGFVWVGNVEHSGEWLIVHDARNVRRWGTSAGLGELAAKGPQPNTKLDPAGTVRVPLRGVVGLIDCEASAWIS